VERDVVERRLRHGRVSGFDTLERTRASLVPIVGGPDEQGAEVLDGGSPGRLGSRGGANAWADSRGTSRTR